MKRDYEQLSVLEYLRQVDRRLGLLTTFEGSGPNPRNYVRTNAGFARTSVRRAAKALGLSLHPRKVNG